MMTLRSTLSDLETDEAASGRAEQIGNVTMHNRNA
jgi:hypothetical protein